MYYGTIIVILNSFHSHFVEIIIAVIFRKFKILIPEISERTKFENNTKFLLDLGFDKIRDAKQNIVAKTNLENYLEILDAYSMLFFSIIGVDFKFLLKKIGKITKLRNFTKFDTTSYYLNYLQNLLKLDYSKNPFITVVLKNYVLSSSEVFLVHKNEMLSNFEKINKEILPKLTNYIKNNAKKDFNLLNKTENYKELEISLKVLEKELQKILKERKVIDKFIKYDEKVRS